MSTAVLSNCLNIHQVLTGNHRETEGNACASETDDDTTSDRDDQSPPKKRSRRSDKFLQTESTRKEHKNATAPINLFPHARGGSVSSDSSPRQLISEKDTILSAFANVTSCASKEDLC